MISEIYLNDISSNDTKPDLIDPQKRVIDRDIFKKVILILIYFIRYGFDAKIYN